VPDSLQRLNSKLKVAVFDAHGKKMKNVTMMHPQELLPCAVPVIAVH
jgi:hypothetical protein